MSEFKQQFKKFINHPWHEDAEIAFITAISKYKSKIVQDEQAGKDYLSRMKESNSSLASECSERFITSLEEMLGENEQIENIPEMNNKNMKESKQPKVKGDFANTQQVKQEKGTNKDVTLGKKVTVKGDLGKQSNVTAPKKSPEVKDELDSKGSKLTAKPEFNNNSKIIDTDPTFKEYKGWEADKEKIVSALEEAFTKRDLEANDFQLDYGKDWKTKWKVSGKLKEHSTKINSLLNKLKRLDEATHANDDNLIRFRATQMQKKKNDEKEAKMKAYFKNQANAEKSNTPIFEKIEEIELNELEPLEQELENEYSNQELEAGNYKEKYGDNWYERWEEDSKHNEYGSRLNNIENNIEKVKNKIRKLRNKLKVVNESLGDNIGGGFHQSVPSPEMLNEKRLDTLSNEDFEDDDLHIQYNGSEIFSTEEDVKEAYKEIYDQVEDEIAEEDNFTTELRTPLVDLVYGGDDVTIEAERRFEIKYGISYLDALYPIENNEPVEDFGDFGNEEDPAKMYESLNKAIHNMLHETVTNDTPEFSNEFSKEVETFLTKTFPDKQFRIQVVGENEVELSSHSAYIAVDNEVLNKLNARYEVDQTEYDWDYGQREKKTVILKPRTGDDDPNDLNSALRGLFEATETEFMTEKELPKSYNFEVYLTDPITFENGAEIAFVDVFARSKKEAIEILKNDVPDFDEIILFNNVTPLDDIQASVYARGRNYSFTSIGGIKTYEDDDY